MLKLQRIGSVFKFKMEESSGIQYNIYNQSLMNRIPISDLAPVRVRKTRATMNEKLRNLITIQDDVVCLIVAAANLVSIS